MHTDLAEIFMHLNEKAEQFPLLIRIMQHCPSLYFILFQSCHANEPNFKKKKIIKVVCILSAFCLGSFSPCMCRQKSLLLLALLFQVF